MAWRVRGVNYKALNQGLLLLRMGSALKENGGEGLFLHKMGSDAAENEELFLQRMGAIPAKSGGLLLQRMGAVPAESEVCSYRGCGETFAKLQTPFSARRKGWGGLQSLIYVIELHFQLIIRSRPHRVRGGSERSDRSFLVTCVFDRDSEITSLTHPQKE